MNNKISKLELLEIENHRLKKSLIKYRIRINELSKRLRMLEIEAEQDRKRMIQVSNELMKE